MEDTINPENISYFEFQPLLQHEGTPVREVVFQQGGCKLQDAIRALRQSGHLSAHFNPLQDIRTPLRWEHTFEGLGFSEADRQVLYPTYGLFEEECLPLQTIIAHLQAVYCNRIGIEFEGFVTEDIACWIRDRFEKLGGRAPLGKEQKKAIYQFLAHAELFEQFIHTKHVGQKRFSLEGAETVIPMLVFLMERLCQHQVRAAVLGMAHRGRLNVLANVLMKPLAHLFAEFEDTLATPIDAGDVKYHKGYQGIARTLSDKILPVIMASNPSHLESVDAVVEGICRGQQQLAGDTLREKIIPLLIHGDASLAGQGVIYETLQLSHLKGYDTGGTIHLIINNQIGFTTNPEQSRSTRYCTDIAKSFGFPVFHVNAEDPETCVWAMISAFELRQKFHVDVFVDVNCYRKHGHNESDEPAFTQPLLYESIRQKKSIKSLYQEELLHEGFSLNELLVFEEDYKEKLAAAFIEKKNFQGHAAPAAIPEAALPPINVHDIKELVRKAYRIPEDLTLHPRVLKVLDVRIQSLDSIDEACIDWSFAETMAFLTILQGGHSIRLTGQDSGRGTFSQRHVVWVDQKSAKPYVPLQELQKASFEVIDSPLSEYAALAFEYGFSIVRPDTLVLWEAQFGDFANNAQVIIDQYIAAGERKWGSACNLTLLLPHGYEGQGPEHSSARMERFLQLSAEGNMTLASPTTPAQYFHLLRRQAAYRKPLIVFTPKGLLRHPACKSTFGDLEGSFQEVRVDQSKDAAKRVLICQGRVYYDLLDAMHKHADTETVIIRLEQLYPFPKMELQQVLPLVERYIFVQEEPENAGAYAWIRSRLEKILPPGKVLEHVNRPESATPAIGSHKIHEQQLCELLDALFKEHTA